MSRLRRQRVTCQTRVIVAKGNGDIEKSKTNARPIVIRDNEAPWNLPSPASCLVLSLLSTLLPFLIEINSRIEKKSEREHK